MTRITDGGALPQHWYQLVEIEGQYEFARTKQPGGVGIIAFLKVPSDAGPVYIDLFDREEEEATRLEGKTVRVAGQIQPPLDDTMPLHMAARDNLPALVSITAIDLVA